MEYSSVSIAGKRRHNEDSCLASQIKDGLLMAVADGIGGHAAGDVASRIAIDTLRSEFTKNYRAGMSAAEIEKLLRNSFAMADENVSTMAVGDRAGMGTTLVAAFVRDLEVFIANTGDSRAYLFNGMLKQITVDHSLVQELVEKGAIDPEKRRTHPMKNVITRSIGGDFSVDLYHIGINSGEVLLLSSDGLHDYIEDDVISKGLNSEETANGTARLLVKSAMPVSEDNISVVVLKR
ncbi:protein serine/threonine phosphatase [Methanolacinia petrolearia DSM 11571]|uniref:Protein serine/threonine phosphatase n=1 Tax=Methanolacinia petrolearia (strain DSM 11571 / OCM 486 / SEBR 4847) TaxID=679926 RepID=E1RFS1_METP4|nr:protein phosphatase 2C domain-containing protein [Methanolacinia petrolearia]ADN37375.1 protein serine/threonine phosphatase [Methanolacinia petrolearia DSM 11571]